MNKVLLIGRLTKDAEYKKINNEGSNLLNFTLAVNEDYVNKDGTKRVQFIPVAYWSKHAENLSKYLTKGKLLCVTGRINIRSYSNDEGIKKYVTQIVAENVKFLESNKDKAVNS